MDGERTTVPESHRRDGRSKSGRKPHKSQINCIIFFLKLFLVAVDLEFSESPPRQGRYLYDVRIGRGCPQNKIK